MQDSSSGGLAALLGFVILAALIAAVVAFFRGPAKRSEEYAKTLASRITDANDAALLMSLYQQKGGKNVVLAWLLTVFLSPTIAYLYIGETTKALIAFVTLQGFGVWWVISWFSMPMEVLAKNKKAADDALTQLRLMRPQLNVSVAPYPIQSAPVPSVQTVYTPAPLQAPEYASPNAQAPTLHGVYTPIPSPSPAYAPRNIMPQAKFTPSESVSVQEATLMTTVPPLPPPKSPAECVSCGNPLFPDSRFCDACGVRILS
jgi:hypothetical protein